MINVLYWSGRFKSRFTTITPLDTRPSFSFRSLDFLLNQVKKYKIWVRRKANFF